MTIVIFVQKVETFQNRAGFEDFVGRDVDVNDASIVVKTKIVPLQLILVVI